MARTIPAKMSLRLRVLVSAIVGPASNSGGICSIFLRRNGIRCAPRWGRREPSLDLHNECQGVSYPTGMARWSYPRCRDRLAEVRRTDGSLDQLHSGRGAGEPRDRRCRTDVEGLTPDPLEVLAAVAVGDLEAGEADDVVVGVRARPGGVVPDRYRDGRGGRDQRRAVGACLVARQAPDEV